MQHSTAMIPEPAGQDRPLSAPTRRFRRRTVIAILAGACAVAAILFVARGWLRGRQSIAADRLRIAEVTRGPLVRDIVADGRITSAKSPTLYAIAAGTVTLKVVAGDAVKRGQPLAIVASPALESRLAQEQATVARLESDVGRAGLDARQRREEAKKRVEQAEVDRQAADRELSRMTKASASGALSEMDLLRAKDALKKADIELAHARSDLAMQDDIGGFELEAKKLELLRQREVVEELSRQVEALTIRSPVDGQAGQVLVAQNANVAANAPVLSVVDLTAFELEIQVPESFARDLAVGMTAEIRGGGSTYDGRVRSVSPQVVDGEVATRIEFVGEPPTGLRENQRMTARIILARKEDVLQVERGSFVDEGGAFAYFIDGDIAERRPLRIGIASIKAVEILDGAKAGDRIVVSGAALFEGADRVRIAGD